MKKLSALLALLLLLSTVSAFAEEATLLWEASSITATANPAVVLASNDLRVGLYTIEGEALCEPTFLSVGGISTNIPGFFTAYCERGLNKHMIIDSTGTAITEAAYSTISGEGTDWALCAVLVEGTSEDYDYMPVPNEYYVITRYDVVYLPERRVVGSLTRSQCDHVRTFGNYLLVTDDAGVLTVYDNALQPVETDVTGLYGDYFTVRDGAIINLFTGETIAEGYTSVTAATDGLLIVRTQDGLYGLMDAEGAMALPAEYRYISYNFGEMFYELSQGETYSTYRYGAYDPVSGVVLPCAYDKVTAMASADGTTYFQVENNDKVGYVNTAGEVTCPIAYSKSAVPRLGVSMFGADLDGTIKLISADGRITPLAGVTEVYAYNTELHDGRYVVVRNADGLWGVIDWHGTLVRDFTQDYGTNFSFADQHHVIVNNRSLYELQ